MKNDILTNRLEVVRNRLYVLHGAAMGDDAVLHRLVPQSELGQVLEQVRIDDLELARQHASGVDVRGVRLETFVVAEDLRGRRSRHRRNLNSTSSCVPRASFAPRVWKCLRAVLSNPNGRSFQPPTCPVARRLWRQASPHSSNRCL
jgi:hypothetical protein